jgi:hypothetical protein
MPERAPVVILAPNSRALDSRRFDSTKKASRGRPNCLGAWDGYRVKGPFTSIPVAVSFALPTAVALDVQSLGLSRSAMSSASVSIVFAA